MADLSITASSVASSSTARLVRGTAGATFTAGQTGYYDEAAGTYKLADCDSGTAAARSLAGIALNGASAGQPVVFHVEGDLTINAVLTAGVTYYLSPNAGGICPVADLASGDYPTILGIAKSTTVLSVKIHESGVPLA